METTETLKEALTRVGDGDQVSLLSAEAQNLNKAQITEFLNNHLNHNLDEETLTSLRKLAKLRVKEGKSVFPWDKLEELDHNEAEDSMGGGTW